MTNVAAEGEWTLEGNILKFEFDAWIIRVRLDNLSDGKYVVWYLNSEYDSLYAWRYDTLAEALAVVASEIDGMQLVKDSEEGRDGG